MNLRLFLIYAIAVMNVWVWIVLPESFNLFLLKIDLLFVLLFGPIVYYAEKDLKKMDEKYKNER